MYAAGQRIVKLQQWMQKNTQTATVTVLGMKATLLS